MKEFSTCSNCLGCHLSDSEPAECFKIRAFLGKNISLNKGRSFGWRTKVKLAVRGTAKDPRIGLFYPGTHDILDLPQCPTHHPKINEAIFELKKWIIQEKIEPYHEETHRGELRYVQMFIGRETERIQLVLVTQGKETDPSSIEKLWNSSPLWHSIWMNIQSSPTNQILGSDWHCCFGNPFLSQKCGNRIIQFHPGAFAQSNLCLFDQILAKIESWVSKEARILEIYAGCGAISLHLENLCQSAILIEENPYAYLSFQESSPPSHFDYIVGDAKKAIPYLEMAEWIIVDPPRKGLDPSLLKALGETSLKRLIYISCCKESFQRDAIYLQKAGWELEDAAMFWLFHGTKHIEIVSKWKKEKTISLKYDIIKI